MALYVAICSSPECSHSASVPSEAALPAICSDCGAAMIGECWKCETAITDVAASYCVGCGVPLKRVLPRREASPFVVICGDPECEWASAGDSTTTMPTRCPRCGSGVTSDCWKCGTRITNLRQHYCAACGVPLKRGRRPVASPSRLTNS